MTARMTWVGIAACGHASFVAADPEYVIGSVMGDAHKRLRKVERLEVELEEYKSLIDELRNYAQLGRQVKLVSDADLGTYTDQMKVCRGENCSGTTADPVRIPTQSGDKNAMEVADVIVSWLRDRNGRELREAFDDMRVRDLASLRAELQEILRAGGKPANWAE